MIDVSNIKRKMVANISNRGRQGEQRTNDDEDINDINSEKGTPELPIMTPRKSIFNDEVNDDEDNDNDEGKDDGYHGGTSWMNERRKQDDEIAMLKRMINALESTIKNMQSTSMVTGRDKAGWTGDKLIFVKDINDFCRERLYPKEKFLRKNWQEYLPNDRRSLYSVCMKHLSIPEESNPKEI